ncbi:hypothetical protein Agub_g11239, partial [Astrephomene gubernaculifera]
MGGLRVLGLLAFAVCLCQVPVLTTTASAPKVALYSSEARNVLDLQWDNGHQNLDRQLRQLGLTLAAATDDRLTGLDAPSAYIIPAQNGRSFYSTTQNMLEVSSYVSAGGLVIILDATSGDGQATREFVASALGYTGNWKLCERTGTSERARRLSRRSRAPMLSEHAYSFLKDGDYDDNAWPLMLEDAHVLTTLNWCEHEDPRAVAIPLYTL